MIVVKIKSGLGNQMFQYALGKRLSLDWGDELKYDLSWYSEKRKGETPRQMEIKDFDIVFEEASKSEIEKNKPNYFAKTLERIRGRLDRNYFFKFHKHLLKKKQNIYLDGYFQSFKYIEPIRKELISDFVLRDGFCDEAVDIKKQIQACDQSVAIHVRRGDYVTTCKDWNGLCSVEYYKKGIDKIRNKYEDLKLFIFSDEIEWAKENLKFDIPMVFVSRPGLKATEEILLMSLCEHQIIANSTFSWWGAWLNQNFEKIVIAPSRWLLAADIDTRDLLPPDWIRI